MVGESGSQKTRKTDQTFPAPVKLGKSYRQQRSGPSIGAESLPKLELAATRHTRSDSGSQFGCRRPHIGCNIRFANILWSLSCRPAKTGGPVGPSLSGQPLSGAAWIRSLYHHEKQLNKVVRLHNSHGSNAMRRLKFNFIKISCVIYKAHPTDGDMAGP